jgi:hypothetical protein
VSFYANLQRFGSSWSYKRLLPLCNYYIVALYCII